MMTIEFKFYIPNYLRSRKHENLENRKIYVVGTPAKRQVFPVQLYLVPPNFHENMFPISLRKHSDKIKQNNLFTLICKMKILVAHAIVLTACAFYKYLYKSPSVLS